MFRVHACGLWDLNVICENLRLITLRSQLEVCEKESSIFFPVALRRPPRLIANPWPLVNPRPGVRMFRSRRWRVSRQASPFLSLPHQSMCAQIHRLNSRRIICFLALHTMASFRPTRRTSSRKSEGTVLTPEAVKELRRATDLALRATKHTARAVGRLMAPYGGFGGRRAPFVAKSQRRAVSPLWGEVRPQKHFCPLQTCSPHSKPSQPPLGA